MKMEEVIVRGTENFLIPNNNPLPNSVKRVKPADAIPPTQPK